MTGHEHIADNTGKQAFADLPEQGYGVWAIQSVHGTDERCLVVEFGIVDRVNVDEPPIWGELSDRYGDDPLDVFVVAHGSIKWDGCSNWCTSQGCAMHHCYPDGPVELGLALVAAYRLAHELLDGPDFECPT